MVSGYTSVRVDPPVQELDSLSLNDQSLSETPSKVALSEDDFDGVLDDLREEGAVDLPAHACRYVISYGRSTPPLTHSQLLRHPFTPIRCQMSHLLQMVLQLSWQHLRLPHREPSRPRKA